MESETEERNINIKIYTFKSTRPHPSVPFAVFHHVPKQAKAEDESRVTTAFVALM